MKLNPHPAQRDTARARVGDGKISMSSRPRKLSAASTTRLFS
jgi:hypothetical protein